MVLSRRLEVIASMISPCPSVTDIGTDHGYLPIWLVEHGVCDHAVASDVRKGPLETAEKNCLEHGIGKDRIELVLSDGLKDITPGEDSAKETLVIAGMGGETIVDILSGEKVKAHSYGAYVFSPHTKQEELRRYLGRDGYRITGERYITDSGKLYVVISAVNGEDACVTDADYLFGPFIDEAIKDGEIYDLLRSRYEGLERMLSKGGLPESRAFEIRKELGAYKEVLKL